LAGYIQEVRTDTTLQDLAFGLPSGIIQQAQKQVPSDQTLFPPDAKRIEGVKTETGRT
jgi:hypothetical protein